MCLYTHNMIANVAEKDIICYKIMKTAVYSGLKTDGLFFSPYMNMGWEIGNEYDHDGANFEDLPLNYEHRTKLYKWENGFFHTFKSLTGAIYHTHWVNEHNTFGVPCVVMKCVIPKGTEYYEGDGAFNCYREDGYASRNIKTVEVVH